jgi:hypothetical protein
MEKSDRRVVVAAMNVPDANLKTEALISSGSLVAFTFA